MKIKILVLEDDMYIASGLLYALEAEGYEPTHVKSVSEAKSALAGEAFNLAIMDIQLPDGTSFDLREDIKRTSTPVIFLTVVDDESTIVKAFGDGAEDYVTKPFRIRELLARIKRTLAKHDDNFKDSDTVTIGSVRIDKAAGKVYSEDGIIELTALEYRLLCIFAANKGILLEREKILEKIWDTDGNFVEDNTLTVYIKRLREKLTGSVEIQTIRGIGYRVDK